MALGQPIGGVIASTVAWPLYIGDEKLYLPGVSVDQLRTFRNVALIEATSFLLLLVATVVKHSVGNEIGVKILGPVHGALFVLYVALALVVRSSQGWGFWKTILVLIGAVLPFGGYVVDAKLLRSRLLTPENA